MQMRLSSFFSNYPLRTKNKKLLMEIFNGIVYVLWFLKTSWSVSILKKKLLPVMCYQKSMLIHILCEIKRF